MPTSPAAPDVTGAARAPFAFVEPRACGASLDRADHLRQDPAALTELWSHARVVLLDVDGRALADDAGRLATPDGRTLSGGPGGIGAAVFLGLDAGGQGWFALDASLAAFDAPQRIDLRAAAAACTTLEAAAFAQARALQHWRQRHRFCGACGGEVALTRAGWLGRCARCGLEHYPRTDPAVIVAVGHGERLLLGRQANWPARRWSVLAGFVEPGESLEQAVAREVLEETGIRVASCRYLASQPWPFPGALMLGFIAEAVDDAADPQVTGELEDARWFDLEALRAAEAREATIGREEDDGGPLLSSPISIARWLIREWLAQRGCNGAPSADR